MPGLERPLIIEKVADDQKIWFISDLHLGDATPCDVFFGKDRHLIALIERVEREGSLLVIVGDAIDFYQAWTFTRVLRAHQELFSAMTRLAHEGRLYYVVGNHDFDISLFREILNFQVCDELHVGKQILVRHGFQFDPYLKDALYSGYHWSTTVHHMVERYLNTWLRIPLGEFYTKGNRLMFWLAHKIAVVAWFANTIGTRFYEGLTPGKPVLDYLDYWAQGNLGDPMGMFRPALAALNDGPWPYVLCGHSHLPGIIWDGPKAYINTGSWTFSSSHYVIWEDRRFAVRDWLTGASITDRFYQPILDGSVHQRGFWAWWRENYMGMFKFREGEERVGRLRGWESYVRDYQYLSQLQPLPEPRQLGERLSIDELDELDEMPSDIRAEVLREPRE